MLDDFPVFIESKDVDPCRFLPTPIEIANMDEGEVAIDGEALHFAGDLFDLLEEVDDELRPVGKLRVVLDVGTSDQGRVQVAATFVEDLVIDRSDRRFHLCALHSRTPKLPVECQLHSLKMKH